MAPRMLICEDTQIPTSPFYGTELTIKKCSELLNISYEECCVMAFKFLKKKQQEAAEKNSIYFCEDKFDSDFEKYVQEKINKKKAKKSKIVNSNVDEKITVENIQQQNISTLKKIKRFVKKFL